MTEKTHCSVTSNEQHFTETKTYTKILLVPSVYKTQGSAVSTPDC